MRICNVPGNLNVIADWMSRSVSDHSDCDDEVEQITGEGCFIATLSELTGMTEVRLPTANEIVEGTREAIMQPFEERDTILGSDGLRRHCRSSKLYIS